MGWHSISGIPFLRKLDGVTRRKFYLYAGAAGADCRFDFRTLRPVIPVRAAACAA